MRTPRALAGTAALALVLGLAAAACGDDDSGGGTTSQTTTSGGADSGAGAEVPVNDWATGVCTSVGSWVESVQSGASEFTAAVADVDDPAAAKQRLADFADDVIAETDTMLSGVEDAGFPDIDDGEQLANDLNTNLAGVRTVFEELKAGVEDLPTDSPQAFISGGQELVTKLNQGMQTFGTAFDDVSQKYQSDELQQAFADSEACSAIG